ncbi:MAG: DUF4199 domain-containing protein [Ignavibacteria bacterium]|nr:DUF4199 domain-containing protein [Ignavibacteria bacterium]
MKKIPLEVKWAFIFIVMTLAWMILEKVIGLHDKYIDKHPVFTNFIAIPAVAVYVLALMDKKKNFYSGVMTWKQGFMCGLIITLIITVVSPLTQIITSEIITPDYFPNAIKYSVSSGLLSQEEADKYFNLGNYIIQGLIGAPVMGIITSAVVAFFVRSKK